MSEISREEKIQVIIDHVDSWDSKDLIKTIKGILNQMYSVLPCTFVDTEYDNVIKDILDKKVVVNLVGNDVEFISDDKFTYTCEVYPSIFFEKSDRNTWRAVKIHNKSEYIYSNHYFTAQEAINHLINKILVLS